MRRLSRGRTQLQLPAIARANVFLAEDASVRPVEKLERQIFVGDAGAANFLVELRRRKLFRAGVGNNIKPGAVFTQTQLQLFRGVRKRITNDGASLDESKRNDRLIVAQLTIEIHLLARFEHSHRSENFLRGGNGLAVGERRKSESKSKKTRGHAVLNVRRPTLSVQHSTFNGCFASYRSLSWSKSHGPNDFLSHQRTMDESGARLVHGRDQQHRDLEAAARRDWAHRAHFRWFQGACVRFIHTSIAGHRGAIHRPFEIGAGSTSSQAGAKRAHGGSAKSASGVSDPFQEAHNSLFRSIRPQQIGAIISIGTHGKQHCDRGVLAAFLPAAWLALLDDCRSDRLLANLPWRALAERCGGKFVSRHRRNITYSRLA